MNRTNPWAWSGMLVATLAFGIVLGLSLGHALFAPRPPKTSITLPPSQSEPASVPPAATASAAVPPATTEPKPRVPAQPAAIPETSTPADAYPAGRHLFVTVNGQWLADAARAMLSELKPAGVLLTENNLGSRTQTFALVKEIKHAAGLGDGLGDFPLVAVQQEGGPYNLLGVADAPSAETIAASGDPELARRLGREYAEACVGRGIALVFAPVLDVFEVGAIHPGLQPRTFGTDYSTVTKFGLAMADGLRQGGVLPVVKHFPGYGAATYGPDGLLVVLNKDYGGLSRVMYPFNEAVVHGVPGMLVGHVAVPALDLDNQRRSAALSPVLVTDLLRTRWKFDGVIIADDVAFNSMTRALGPEAATVQALAAGCDAVLVLDPDPDRIRRVAAAVASAVADGTLSTEALEQSAARIARWQEAIGNLHPIESAPAAGQVAEAPPSSPVAAPIETVQSPSAQPDPIVVAESAAETPPAPTETPQAAPEAAPTAEPAPPPPVVDVAAPAPDAAVETASVPASATESPAAIVESPPAEPAAPPSPEPEKMEVAAATPPASDGPEESPTPTDAPAPQPVQETAAPPAPEAAAPESSPPTAEPAAEPVAVVAEASPPPAPVESEPAAATPQEAERSSIVHTVKEGEQLSAIAEMYAVSLIDLIRWNAIEDAQVSPGTELTIYLPDESEMKQASVEPQPAEVVAKAPEEPKETVQDVVVPAGKLVHTVAEGDTLSSVAGQYAVSMADITLWNGLEDAALKPGQQLTIFLDPGAPAPSAPAPEALPPEPAATASTEPAPAGATSDAPRPAHYTPKDRVVEYVVQPGDTLMKIARKYQTTAENLMQLNALTDAGKIFAGQKLKVPAPN